MFCERIYVENFRNIDTADISFCSGTNILVGNNAQGKTNLLEAIYMTTLGKSFRRATDKELIQFDHDCAYIKNTYHDTIRQNEISLRIFSDRRQRRIEQNRVKISKMSDMVGAFRTVLFCPEHLSIVKEGPAMRRNFLDVAISQLRPMYMRSLQRYQTVLKERNSLIKQAELSREQFDQTIDLWSSQLAEEAAIITKYRVEYLNDAREYISNCFSDMTGQRECPTLVYKSSSHLTEEDCFDREKIKRAYMELYNTRHDREIGAGMTLWGIHRDDIEMELNGKDARIFCSQGQQRSFALAMKIAEGEMIRRECSGDYPVFLLDDVLSELDGERKKYLIESIFDKQVIMTTCENVIEDAGKIIRVENGRFYDTSKA